MNQLLGMCGLHVAAERAVVSKSTKVVMKMTEGDSPSNGALLAVLMALSSILRSENHPLKKGGRDSHVADTCTVTLGTFSLLAEKSAHKVDMEQLATVDRHVDKNCICLVDELGSATEPPAAAILGLKLLERMRTSKAKVRFGLPWRQRACRDYRCGAMLSAGHPVDAHAGADGHDCF